jgi:hypothetical protein
VRRRYVSDEELEQVIKLKRGGASWLRIEKETGVPRRTAKRAYDEWESTKSSEELKRARMAIAEEEFRTHMEDLTSVARSLADSLHVPVPIYGIKSADGVFEELWKRDIREGRGEPVGDREKRRRVRQNRMLFEALREHTVEVVRWQALEEWKERYGRYMEHCVTLRSEARKVMADVLLQRAELKGRIDAMAEGREVVETMVTGLVEAIWRHIWAGEPCGENVSWGGGLRGSVDVSFGKEASLTILRQPDEDLARGIVDVCKIAIDNICKGKMSYLVGRIDEDMKVMEEVARELEESLDDLVLRPVILRTRCSLCPV